MLVRVERCRCPCHETERGIFNAARHTQNYLKAFVHAGKKREHEPPPLTDAVEAVSACPRCQGKHAVAIVYVPPPTAKPPWIDLPPTNADGEGVE